MQLQFKCGMSSLSVSGFALPSTPVKPVNSDAIQHQRLTLPHGHSPAQLTPESRDARVCSGTVLLKLSPVPHLLIHSLTCKGMLGGVGTSAMEINLHLPHQVFYKSIFGASFEGQNKGATRQFYSTVISQHSPQKDDFFSFKSRNHV